MTKLTNTKPKSFARTLMVWSSLALFLTVLTIDMVVLDVGLIREARPALNNIYFLRAALLALCSWLFVSAVVYRVSPSQPSNRAQPKSNTWVDWEIAGRSTELPARRENSAVAIRKLAVWLVLSISVILPFGFLIAPGTFSLMAREGRPVETASAALHFMNAGLFTYVLIVLFRSAD